MSGYIPDTMLNQEGLLPKDSENHLDNVMEIQSIKVNNFEYFKVYKIRWFMLYILTICSVCMAMHFLHFSIIANIIVDYYGVSYEAVDWSAMMFLFFYIPCVFPAMLLSEKIGIRASLLITIFGTCAAAWIKVGSVAPDRYWVVLLGQAVVSIFQVFVMVLPARFASAWFGKNQVGLACGIAAVGIELGIAVSSIIPTIIVKPSKNKDDVTHDLYVLNTGFALLSTVCLIMTAAFFKSVPPSPPSRAQTHLQKHSNVGFIESTKQLFKNWSYVVFFIAYGIDVGILYVLPTLLNQIIIQYYPNGTKDAGRIGLIMLVAGIPGSTVCGYILDKIQRYKLTTLLVFGFYLIGMILFTLALLHSITAVYIAAVILGFFMAASYSIGLEVAAQITYPVPESTSSGYILASAQFIGIILTYLYSHILYKYGAIWANIATCVQLLMSTVLVVCMKFELRRSLAEEVQEKVRI